MQNQSISYPYSKLDREWIEGKRGITNKKGEFVTLDILGKKIEAFREDVKKASIKKSKKKNVKLNDSINQLINSIEEEEEMMIVKK